MRVIACGSPYGKGGIGQHFAQLVEESRHADLLLRYYAPKIRPGDGSVGQRISLRDFDWMRRFTPLRFRQSWISYTKGEFFDRKVGSALDCPQEAFMGFAGKSLHSFRRANALGYRKLELVAVTSHIDNVMRLHRKAHEAWGINDGWLNEAQRRKTLREYDLADVIYVHSEYTRASFIREGIPTDKIVRTYLGVDTRFRPATCRRDDDTFRVVYVGRVEVTKGVPLLLEAFSRLPLPKAQLVLVGGWSTRRMRRYIQDWLRRDPRIRCAPGDPLPALQQADLLVHPTYQDGFGYAPMEALACGVPVIVTEDTGMKEYVQEGVNGYVVPTGSWQALLDRMEYHSHHPLAQIDTNIPYVRTAVTKILPGGDAS